ncbi:hypothetical protein G9U51_09795 [Calidifontibacter sp. DB0510]|uniref:Uncharacterized protein n=1 Tax=Metallococcus carri TaxID=1656884 RepID=A0A967B5N8_9MICO|nr:hypothetical protein [Metallococcus carri]NHN56067.1 hypothetical protein [Metallococcus carri]NOP37476.1 hypothetical protein [Calidifontibacter sp. DB2511S]
MKSLVVKSAGSIDWPGIGQSAIKVLLVGLVFGAGLPALYAVGLRLWDAGTGGVAKDGTVTKANPLALAGAALAFVLIVAAVVCGLLLVMKKTIAHYTGWTVFPGLG